MFHFLILNSTELSKKELSGWTMRNMMSILTGQVQFMFITSDINTRVPYNVIDNYKY